MLTNITIGGRCYKFPLYPDQAPEAPPCYSGFHDSGCGWSDLVRENESGEGYSPYNSYATLLFGGR